MGSTISVLTMRLNRLEERISALEKDFMNLYISSRNSDKKIQTISNDTRQNTNTLRNMALLEEGRSIYTPRTRISHTASTYRR